MPPRTPAPEPGSEPATPPVTPPAISPAPPPTPGRLRRTLHAASRRRVVVPAIVAAVIGLDAWMVVTISAWEGEEADLRAEATQLGQRVGAVEAELEGTEAQLALVEELSNDAQTWSTALSAEAASVLDVADAYRQAGIDLRSCASLRQSVTALLWQNAPNVAGPMAQANQECAAAQARLDALVAAEG